jgi:hypothetical protein
MPFSKLDKVERLERPNRLVVSRHPKRGLTV